MRKLRLRERDPQTVMQMVSGGAGTHTQTRASPKLGLDPTSTERLPCGQQGPPSPSPRPWGDHIPGGVRQSGAVGVRLEPDKDEVNPRVIWGQGEPGRSGMATRSWGICTEP